MYISYPNSLSFSKIDLIVNISMVCGRFILYKTTSIVA